MSDRGRRGGPHALTLALVALTACAMPHRIARFLAPPRVVVAAPPSQGPPLVEVRTALADGEAAPWEPHPSDAVGAPFLDPVTITTRGRVELDPRAPDVVVRLYLRHAGLVDKDFYEVKTVTGAVSGELPNEIRYLAAPAPLPGPVTLPMADLANVYNGYALRNDDLLLIEAQAGDRVERYLLSVRKPGLWVGAGADVLVRAPLPWASQPMGLSPAAALTISVGYRSVSGHGHGAGALDRVALVGSAGVGADQLQMFVMDADLQTAGEETRSLVRGALLGAGVQLFDFVSLQVIYSTSDARAGLQPWSLGAGFDATRFAAFTQEAWRRLTAENTLSDTSDDIK